jgi:hypothetical protein
VARAYPYSDQGGRLTADVRSAFGSPPSGRRWNVLLAACGALAERRRGLVHGSELKAGPPSSDRLWCMAPGRSFKVTRSSQPGVEIDEVSEEKPVQIRGVGAWLGAEYRFPPSPRGGYVTR